MPEWVDLLDSANQKYDPSTSGLSATNVKTALDELAQGLSGGVVWLSTFYPGLPTADLLMASMVAPAGGAVFPADLSDSRLSAKVAATAETVFLIKKGAVQVGSITVAAAGTTGVFAMASETTLAAGEVLDVYAPSTPDGTLADVSMTIVGSR